MTIHEYGNWGANVDRTATVSRHILFLLSNCQGLHLPWLAQIISRYLGSFLLLKSRWIDGNEMRQTTQHDMGSSPRRAECSMIFMIGRGMIE